MSIRLLFIAKSFSSHYKNRCRRKTTENDRKAQTRIEFQRTGQYNKRTIQIDVYELYKGYK
jgi:hypothetical protein